MGQVLGQVFLGQVAADLSRTCPKRIDSDLNPQAAGRDRYRDRSENTCPEGLPGQPGQVLSLFKESTGTGDLSQDGMDGGRNCQSINCRLMCLPWQR